MAFPRIPRSSFFGADPQSRRWARMCLASTLTYVLYSAIGAVQVHFGFADAALTAALIGTALAGNAVVYAAIRSGFSRRFPNDPSLGRTQLMMGIVLFWMSYAISGPGSQATLVIVASHIVYAMFGLPARQVHAFAAISVVGLACVMAGCHVLQPERYPAGQQIVALLYTALVVTLITRLTRQVSAMQERLRAQRNQLKTALARVQALAERDELTQLPNRRTMNDRLQQAQRQLERDRSSACVALLDIDRFKRINDDHGHAAGDEVLRRFAALGGAALRGSDQLARWGGEEFLLLMPQTDGAAARSALQRLREAVAGAGAALADAGSAAAITFSAGVTRLRPGEPIGNCIARADHAMYRAKEAGRDRVEFDPALEVVA